METQVFVYVDLRGAPHLVGRLWGRTRKSRESATFEYEKTWLAHADRFALEPALTLGRGPFHTSSDKPLLARPRRRTCARCGGGSYSAS